MSLTTQSESVPLVEAIKLAMGWPLIFTGAVSVSEIKATTSGRPETSRWSLVSQVRQGTLPAKPTGKLGRPLNGTGLAGTDTYSSHGSSLGAGSRKLSMSPKLIYNKDRLTLLPPYSHQSHPPTQP